MRGETIVDLLTVDFGDNKFKHEVMNVGKVGVVISRISV